MPGSTRSKNNGVCGNASGLWVDRWTCISPRKELCLTTLVPHGTVLDMLQADSTSNTTKDLDVALADDRMVLIMDDTEQVRLEVDSHRPFPRCGCATIATSSLPTAGMDDLEAKTSECTLSGGGCIVQMDVVWVGAVPCIVWSVHSVCVPDSILWGCEDLSIYCCGCWEAN